MAGPKGAGSDPGGLRNLKTPSQPYQRIQETEVGIHIELV